MPPGASRSRLNSIPHRVRALSRHTPHHLILTIRQGVPRLHRRAAREIFAVVIDSTRKRYPCVSFTTGCLMPDHIHLLGQTTGAPSSISRAIQFLAANLARKINRAFGLSGAVFRERYFSRVLKTASEVLQVLRYIGLNPVRAGYVKRPEQWPANGIRPYLGGYLERSPWSFTGWVYGVLGFFKDPAGAMRRILEGRQKPVRSSGGRQLRLPFTKGLPHRP